MVCHDNYINPLPLEGDGSDEQSQQEGGDPTVGMGTGRRKKRSTVKRILRNKRQEAPTELGLSENVTLVSSLKKRQRRISIAFSFLLRAVYLQNLLILCSTVSKSDAISLDSLALAVYKWTSTLVWMRDSFL